MVLPRELRDERTFGKGEFQVNFYRIARMDSDL
jgi:hypothetical protein